MRRPLMSAAAVLLAASACTEETRPSSPASPSASAPAVRETPFGPAPTTPSGRTIAMKLRLTLGGHPVTATLNDSATRP